MRPHYDPVLRAADIRAASTGIRSQVGKIEDSALVAFTAPRTPEQQAIAAEQETDAARMLRRLANRHGCRCGDPAHAAGEFHRCACTARGHVPDLVAARLALEAVGLVGATEGRDERLNEWGNRRQDKGRKKPAG